MSNLCLLGYIGLSGVGSLLKGGKVLQLLLAVDALTEAHVGEVDIVHVDLHDGDVLRLRTLPQLRVAAVPLPLDLVPDRCHLVAVDNGAKGLDDQGHGVHEVLLFVVDDGDLHGAVVSCPGQHIDWSTLADVDSCSSLGSQVSLPKNTKQRIRVRTPSNTFQPGCCTVPSVSTDFPSYLAQLIFEGDRTPYVHKAHGSL
jgi:hypothetical protein